MARRNAAPKRVILPDPQYGNEQLAKFINCVMQDGKKSIAEKIVYGALEQALQKLKKIKASGKEEDEGGSRALSNPVDVMNWVFSSIRPAVEVKSRRVGGSTYQVPVEVSDKRGQALSIRWLIDAARKRSEKTMVNQLAAEMVDACMGRGAAMKKKIDTLKMAEANKAFAHFRW